MVAHSEERIFRMAEGQMALGDEGKSGVNIGKMIYSMGDSAGRAYLIGNGDEGSEGTSGRLPLYKKMAHTTE